MSGIPKNIPRESVIQVIKEIDKNGFPEKYESTHYDLIYENKMYPSKYVVLIANRIAMNCLYLNSMEENRQLIDSLKT